MINLRTVAITAAASLLSASVFANQITLQVTPEFRSAKRNKSENTIDSDSHFTQNAITLGADYQVAQGVPIALGLQGSYAKDNDNSSKSKDFTSGTSIEGGITARAWLSEEVTGTSLFQPFVVAGYTLGKYSDDVQAVAAEEKTITNSGLQHGFMVKVGNAFAITKTASFTTAYQYKNLTSNLEQNDTKKTKDDRSISSHTITAGLQFAI